MSLLTLPPELRNIVWDYCLGHNYIHITEWPKDSTTHSLCRSMISDLAAQDFCYNIPNASVSVKTSYRPNIIPTRRVVPPGQRSSGSDLELFLKRFPPDSRYFEYFLLHEPCLRHIPCGKHLTYEQSFPPDPSFQGQQLHLALMRTSKLIYEETFETLWTRNTFAFDFGAIFNRFIQRRTDEQRLALRHLVLNTMGRFWNPLHFPHYEPDMPA